MEALTSLIDKTLGKFIEAEDIILTRQDEETEAEQWKDVMGKYQMDMSEDGILGQGSFCICRKGRVVETGELVAIKVYKSLRSSSSESTLKKFKRSVAVLKKLHEPFECPADAKLWNPQLEHVKPGKLFMRLVDYSQDEEGEPCCDTADGKLYLISELAQQSLKDFVARRRKEDSPPSKETVRCISKSIVLVMAGLHAKGLVHLDIKPENLMVFDGCLKLIDVDGCIEIGSTISCNDPSISFSPVYCAPEWAGFLLGEEGGCISAAPGLDTWSVGCTICELVTLGDAILKPWYIKFVRCNRRQGASQFMQWLMQLEDAPVPKSIMQFDADLAQFVAGCLMVCDKTQRQNCAESLNDPYLALDKLQRTKSSPIKVHVQDDA